MKTPTNENWQRISQIIEHYGFNSVTSFATHIGLNRGENLYQIKRGNNGISRELADRLADTFSELSKAWILTGEGTMMNVTQADPKMKEVVGIPYYPNFPKNRPPSEPEKVLYFSKELIDDADFAVRCKTDELLPLYNPGSVLFLRRCALSNPIIYGELYFIITDYCRIYRIIRKSEKEGEVILESPNRDKYDETDIPVKDMSELYLII